MMNGGTFRQPLLPRLWLGIHQQQQRFMAGHNKWSKIKRKKGVKDQARSTGFSKASKAITSEARACNGDLSNLQLQSAIARAKSIQLPKARIQDAIDKHLATKDQVELTDMRYDAMLNVKGRKVACILTALTDNRNRTAANVRSTISKAGGELLLTASLNYLFEHVGVAVVEDMQDEDNLWECALEAGANDVDVDGESALITCDASDLWNVVSKLREDGFKVTEFEQRYVTSDADLAVRLDEEAQQEQLDRFLDKMEEDKDVTHIYHNAIIDDTTLN